MSKIKGTGTTRNHRTLAGLMGLAGMAGLVLASGANADYLSHRSTELAFAQEDFSTWVPRKGKMSYEKDASQPGFGSGGRAKKYTVNCKQLQALVGPNGKAKNGDEIFVSGKGGCDISSLAIHKAVTIMPVTLPQVRRPPVTSDLDKALPALAARYPVKMTCSTLAGPCITVNIDAGKYAAIIGFHIKANNQLLAPLIESRSGGIVLKLNYIEGEQRSKAAAKQQIFERATAILVHGSNAIIEKNTIAYTRTGIVLVPTQRAPKGSGYSIANNTFARITMNAIQADGSIFMGKRPGVNINVSGNQFDAAGADIMASYTALNVKQNFFGPSAVHMTLISGIASIKENIFFGAEFDAIQLNEAPKVYIDHNLFEGNARVISGLEYSLVDKSPYPSGNICRDQGFASFYAGAPHMVSYLDIETKSVTNQVSFKGKKPSRGKLRKARRKEPALWSSYDAFLSGLDEKYTKSVNENGKDEMWGPFKAHFYKSKEPVVAHILYNRSDVNPQRGFSNCLDYSLIYKFQKAPPAVDEDGNNIFSSP